MTAFQEKFEAHLTQFNTAPFLFVGSGIPRRYLNLENWEQLLMKFAAESGQNYAYLKASADRNLPRIASLLAEKYHDFWWSDPKFEESRKSFDGLADARDSGLKIEISDYLSHVSINSVKEETLKAELQALGNAVVDGVITTNYDRILEEIFPDFNVYIGQDQLIFSASFGVAEIYKIHGCCTAPNSLVLTENDYALFDERNPYLTAKLLTIFTEHPVIFLGYSLSDPNIQNILGAIARCLTTSNVNKLRDRLIIVQWDAQVETPVIQNSNMILGEFTIPIIEIRAANFLEIFQVLASLKRKFPAKLLRSLKEHVYDLVLSTEISEKLYVQNIDGDLDKSEIDVVFGVGLFRQLQQTGYKGLTRDDLIEDLLPVDGKKHKPVNALQVVTSVLPEIIKNAKYVPLFKYLRDAGYLDPAGNLIKPLATEKLTSASSRQRVDFYPAPFYQGKRGSLTCTKEGFRDFIRNKTPKEIITYVALFEDDCYDLELMKEFLTNNRALQTGASTSTAYYMMVCLYDMLMYKKQPASVRPAVAKAATGK